MKYLDDSYNTLIKQSYCYSAEGQLTYAGFAIAKALYQNNYVINGTGKDKIPHKIHQIWLGSKLPDAYRKFTDSWQKYHPTWEYKLWTDDDVKEFGLQNEKFYYQSKNFGQKSDILRYEILNRFGGLYVDTDFECLKPFNDLMYLNFFTGLGYSREFELYPALICCVPNHLVVQRCINDMTRLGVGSWQEIFNTTGSFYFTKCFLKEINEDAKGIVAFPMGFFYPWSNNVRKELKPYNYVMPYSYALHHWAISWNRIQSYV